MAIQIQGNGGVVAEVEPSLHRSVRVSNRSADPGALGSFRFAVTSGLTTGVAAATATAGHVFAFRWSNGSAQAIVRYMAVEAVTITGFTAAQECGFDVMFARSYTVSHSGGTGLTFSGNNMKKRSSMNSTLLGDARISTTGALTAGTHTFDSHAILVAQYADLAAAATVAKGRVFAEINLRSAQANPLVLSQDTGIVVRNSIAQGAAGTMRFNVTMEWEEYLNSGF